MFLTDRVSVSSTRKTADGYLVADVRVARAGNIQEYRGYEVGRPELDVVRLYRPEGEVFSDTAMTSYAHRPVTIEHPAKMVDADTWKAVSVGQTGGDVVRDGEYVRVPLVLMDSAAIREFEAGKRELSMGYTSEIVFQDGVTPDGKKFDAVQTQLKMNHLAVVGVARGGPELRIGDGRSPDAKDRANKPNPTEKSTMSDTNTRTILVDGLSVTCTDAGATAIAKLQAQISDMSADTERKIKQKEADIDRLQAEIDDLKAKEMKDSDIDARVQARADLLTDAKSVNEADYRGKSDAEVRKAAVIAKLGDSVVAGKSDAYIEARFDMLVEDATADPVTKALKDGKNVTPVNDHGYAASVADFNRTKKEA